jgi:hypothetical protein
MSPLALLCLLALASHGDAEPTGIEIVSYDEGGLVHGDWWLNVEVSGNVTRVQASVDDGPPVDLVLVMAGHYSVVLDTTALKDGSHDVGITARGEGADPPSDQATVHLVVDNTPPEMVVSWDVGSNTSRPFGVSVILRDDHPEGAEAWVTVSDQDDLRLPLSPAPVGFAGPVDIVPVSQGLHAFKVMAVDGAGNIAESGERQVMVWKLPDLAPVEFDWYRNEYQTPGETYNRSYSVRNIGFEPSGPFVVAFQVNNVTVAMYDINRSLGPNETFKGYVVWTPRMEGSYDLSIRVDPDDSIHELDEENNVLTIREGFGNPVGCFSIVPVLAVPTALIPFLWHRGTARPTRRQARPTRAGTSGA